MLPSSRRRVAPLAAVRVLLALVLALLLGACGGDPAVDPDQVDSLTAPSLGACRQLTPSDVARPSNASRAVACDERHTAETFAVGDLPADLADAAYDDPRLSAWAYQTCTDGLRTFLGADESLAMRSVISWAWFRPSEKAWGEGARWYRCDAVGGGEQSRAYVSLPETARGILGTRPERRDRWMVCAVGASVGTAPRVPCTRPHDWRAVGTIRVGKDADAYPGDAQVEATTQDFCSTFVGAWLGYPDDYDYGYTWFHQAEWDAGNRRSVCWARTAQ